VDERVEEEEPVVVDAELVVVVVVVVAAADCDELSEELSLLDAALESVEDAAGQELDGSWSWVWWWVWRMRSRRCSSTASRPCLRTWCVMASANSAVR